MKRGFTLIELSVVLVILALVTHLAVREMSTLRDSRAASAAASQLSELKDAVYSARPGEEPTGFLVDMGRLPLATARTGTNGRVSASLSELWRRPAGVAVYSVKRAVAESLAVPAPEKAALVDPGTSVACGWRGPYLRVPAGRDRLLDPWGNPFENRDSAGYDRLFAPDGSAAGVGSPVASVRHLGSDGRADSDVAPASVGAADGAIRFTDAEAAGRLDVEVSFVGPDGPVAVTGDVRCRWYAPCGSAITGAVATVSAAASPIASFSLGPVPAGVCTLAIDVGGECRARERVTVGPGGLVKAIRVSVR